MAFLELINIDVFCVYITVIQAALLEHWVYVPKPTSTRHR
jgi:hypothetical protein